MGLFLVSGCATPASMGRGILKAVIYQELLAGVPTDGWITSMRSIFPWQPPPRIPELPRTHFDYGVEVIGPRYQLWYGSAV
jgi:hypothetical protein